MEVRPGYKQTEVGVIPEEWNVRRLCSLANEISDGIHTTPKYVTQSDFYFVNGNNLVNDEIVVAPTTMCVSEHEYKALRKPLTDQTLLFSINGTIGNLAYYRGEKVVLGKSAAYINITRDISKEFVAYCLKSRPTALFFENELTGTTIRNLSLQSLRNTPIPCPPTVKEQRAIATALSDVDALLAKLDALIAKKRDLKHAAMQQLLTGQTRLPGFSGEWEVKKLGELANICSGGTPSTTQPQFWNGNILWCTPTDITALNGHKYLKETSRRITDQGLKYSSAEMIPSNSIVMTSRATIGECALNVVPVSTNQGFKNFVPFENVHVEFLYYLLLTKKQSFISLCGGSTFLEIGKNQLAIFEVRLPTAKAEQSAIATVLSDMDAEIAALVARRDKTRALKQGMMQELLTGRIRLV